MHDIVILTYQYYYSVCTPYTCKQHFLIAIACFSYIIKRIIYWGGLCATCPFKGVSRT